jgi:hypothetical protein
LFAFVHIHQCLQDCGGIALGPVGTAANPLAEHCDFLSRNLAVWRHAQVFGLVIDGLEEDGLFRRPRRDGSSTVAAFEPARTRVEIEAALGFLGLPRMAFAAMGDQDRPNLAFIELKLLLVAGGRVSLTQHSGVAWTDGQEKGKEIHAMFEHAKLPRGANPLNGVRLQPGAQFSRAVA